MVMRVKKKARAQHHADLQRVTPPRQPPQPEGEQHQPGEIAVHEAHLGAPPVFVFIASKCDSKPAKSI